MVRMKGYELNVVRRAEFWIAMSLIGKCVWMYVSEGVGCNLVFLWCGDKIQVRRADWLMMRML